MTAVDDVAHDHLLFFDIEISDCKMNIWKSSVVVFHLLGQLILIVDFGLFVGASAVFIDNIKILLRCETNWPLSTLGSFLFLEDLFYETALLLLDAFFFFLIKFLFLSHHFFIRLLNWSHSLVEIFGSLSINQYQIFFSLNFQKISFLVHTEILPTQSPFIFQQHF